MGHTPGLINMTSLALIIDKSHAYINFQKDSVRHLWGHDSDDSGIRHVTRLDQAGGTTLFGDSPQAHLWLNDGDAVNDLNQALQWYDSESFQRAFPSGVVVMSDVSQAKTKTLSKTVEKLDGVVYATPSSEKMKLPEKLVRATYVNADAREFLIDYVGEEYDTLIPLIRSIMELTPEQQRRLNVDQLSNRLPQPPGSLPPWEIEKPLFATDAAQAIDVLHRVSKNSSRYLIVLKMLRHKINLLFRVATLLNDDTSLTQKEISDILNETNNYGLKLTMQRARSLGLDKTATLAQRTSHYDKQVRGGSQVHGIILLEAMIIDIIDILKK